MFDFENSWLRVRERSSFKPLIVRGGFDDPIRVEAIREILARRGWILRSTWPAPRPGGPRRVVLGLSRTQRVASHGTSDLF
jgi:hypothetical protein